MVTVKRGLELAETSTLYALLAILAIGPWTRSLAQIFAIAEFERRSVVDMAWYLLRKTPASLWYGAPYFIVVPFVLLALRVVSARVADRIRLVALGAGTCFSVGLLPLLFMPSKDIVEHALGRVIAADFYAMWVWHAILCVLDDVPPWTLGCGPLFGLCFHLYTRKQRANSLIGGIAVLYLHIGILYESHAELHALGHPTLTNTKPFSSWQGYELYALVTVVWSFVVICASIPTARTIVGWAEICAYLILVNANVAAAWVASVGVVRAALI